MFGTSLVGVAHFQPAQNVHWMKECRLATAYLRLLACDSFILEEPSFFSMTSLDVIYFAPTTCLLLSFYQYIAPGYEPCSLSSLVMNSIRDIQRFTPLRVDSTNYASASKCVSQKWKGQLIRKLLLYASKIIVRLAIGRLLMTFSVV